MQDNEVRDNSQEVSVSNGEWTISIKKNPQPAPSVEESTAPQSQVLLG